MNPKIPMVYLVYTALASKKPCCRCFVPAQMLCHTTVSHVLLATVYKEVAVSCYKITNSNRIRQIFTEIIQSETLHVKASKFFWTVPFFLQRVLFFVNMQNKVKSVRKLCICYQLILLRWQDCKYFSSLSL